LFIRQKVVLWMLREAARPLHRTELMKWSFLLRHESASGGGNAFYDFLPYRFGPFSFCLFREISKLEDLGFVQATGETGYSVDPSVAIAVSGPGGDIENDIRQLVTRFRSVPQKTLVDYVYERYPSYTVHSEIRKLATLPAASPAIYTAGYEGLSIDAFLNMLITHGVKRLIDVRNNPIARRYGFHKSTLSRLTGRLGIDYRHFPQLGIRSMERQAVHGIDEFQRLFDKYEATTLRCQTEAIGDVASLMEDEPSVLLCMEQDPMYCHRQRLATTVARLTRFKVCHLSNAD
jgi:uncharacterized protein (DUF488 family)